MTQDKWPVPAAAWDDYLTLLTAGLTLVFMQDMKPNLDQENPTQNFKVVSATSKFFWFSPSTIIL